MDRWEGRDSREWAELLGVPQVELHRTLASTSDRARAWIAEGVPLPLLVLAEEQSRGRGRGGASWASPAGAGVWASVALEAGALETDRLLALRVGMALAGRLGELTGGSIGVKWPNDLLLRTPRGWGKVAGILCERLRAPGARNGSGVVVGVGVNVTPVAVSPVSYVTAALSDVAEPEGRSGPGRAAVLRAVVEAILDARAQEAPRFLPWEEAHWAELDVLAGQAVAVASSGAAGGVESGIAEGVDPMGRLAVRTPGGRRVVEAGSVRILGRDEGPGDPPPAIGARKTGPSESGVPEIREKPGG